MTRIEKLYASLLANHAAMRFRDFQSVLAAFGFTLDRIKGSHHIYKHPDIPRMLSIQPRVETRQSPIKSNSFSIWWRSSGLK